PTVSADGTLRFTTAPDVSGSAVITLELSDDGGTADGGVDTSAPQNFTITVTPVNDPPSASIGGDPSVLEDAGAQSVAGWLDLSTLSAGPADEAGQTVSHAITANSNPGLFAVAPTV